MCRQQEKSFIIRSDWDSVAENAEPVQELRKQVAATRYNYADPATIKERCDAKRHD